MTVACFSHAKFEVASALWFLLTSWGYCCRTTPAKMSMCRMAVAGKIVAMQLLRTAHTDLITVAELLGHSNIVATAIYTQPTSDDLVKAVEQL